MVFFGYIVLSMLLKVNFTFFTLHFNMASGIQIIYVACIPLSQTALSRTLNNQELLLWVLFPPHVEGNSFWREDAC